MERDTECIQFYEEIQELRQEESSRLEISFAGGANFNYRFFRIQSLTYEKDFPRLEAFENVVASINKPQCRLVYYLRGTSTGVEFYVGIVEDPDKRGEFNDLDYGNMLRKAFAGNYLGSTLTPCDSIAQQICKENLRYSTILGIPSRNKEKEDISFQGVDRLVNIMSGLDYHLLVVWEPVSKGEVERFDATVKEIYARLQRISKHSVQVSEQCSEQEGTSFGTNSGTSTTVNDGWSDTKGSNTGWSKNSNAQSGGTSTSRSSSGGTARGNSSGENRGTSHATTTSSSQAVTWEEQNKVAAEYIKYIDDELLPRLRQGRAKGMYSTSVYLAAPVSANLQLLENAVTSIYQGESSTFFPLQVRRLPNDESTRNLVSSFSIYKQLHAQSSLLPLCSRPIGNHRVGLGTWLTPAEISIIAGLPQKEVPGLELRQQVGFGLNIAEVADAQKIHIGHMVQEGTCLENRPVALSRKDIDKHMFIAGTTGAGKTSTCHRLLHDANMPFLVIEPAKTEYRVLHNDPKFSGILLFTVGNEKGVPFRFNPFEFLPGEGLSAHVDQLKACFMTSFDMEAAIPNLLEEALYKTYEAFGWSFRDDSNVFLGVERHKAWECGGAFFPTISDYIGVIDKVVAEKGFDERLKNDYLGSIKARLDSLRAGVKGLMLDTRLSVDFDELLDQRVVFELEELKSGEDKSFIMGLVLGRLLEALKARHKKEPSFKHITLIEEAHRLLSRPMPGDSPNRKLGVEMFADMLAEVRKYGESLIIVDQIPNKLAPEVLKNTNTKIIHKIFSKDDKEAVGDTMALDEKQRDYLSHLLVGEAIVFSQGWKKPVHVKVEMLEGVETSEDVSEDVAFAAGWKYWLTHPWILCPEIPKSFTGELDKKAVLQCSCISHAITGLFKGAMGTPGEECLDELFALKQEVRSLLGNEAYDFFYGVWRKKLIIRSQSVARKSTAAADLDGWQQMLTSAVRDILDAEREALPDVVSKYVEIFN